MTEHLRNLAQGELFFEWLLKYFEYLDAKGLLPPPRTTSSSQAARTGVSLTYLLMNALRTQAIAMAVAMTVGLGRTRW
jgi:hypothetical protein